MMYGIVDCDNCYVSCERVFRPDLEGKVVVLSGCVAFSCYCSSGASRTGRTGCAM